MACQHSPDDQTLQLQAEDGEDDFIHLLSGPDRVACEHQDDEQQQNDIPQTDMIAQHPLVLAGNNLTKL